MKFCLIHAHVSARKMSCDFRAVMEGDSLVKYMDTGMNMLEIYDVTLFHSLGASVAQW